MKGKELAILLINKNLDVPSTITDSHNTIVDSKIAWSATTDVLRDNTDMT